MHTGRTKPLTFVTSCNVCVAIITVYMVRGQFKVNLKLSLPVMLHHGIINNEY